VGEVFVGAGVIVFVALIIWTERRRARLHRYLDEDERRLRR
jgi:hypothetical protein